MGSADIRVLRPIGDSMTDETTPAAMRARYAARIAAEIASLAAATDDTRADRAPVDLDQTSVGRLSRMDAMQQQAMAAATEARRQARLRALRAAEVRLAGTEFGWCEDCGEPIAPRRLDLDPTLTRCVSCAR